MLTFLTIDKAESLLFPIRSRISAETKILGGIEIKHIKCIHRRGKIPYGKIRKLSGNESDRLLTKEDLILPEKSGLRRFYCSELASRLCLNTAIEILKDLGSLSDNIRTAVYDPDGRIADGAGALLKFTNSLTVVTRMTGLYSAEAERIMNESGAFLNVSKGMKSLEKAKLIVAPHKLKTRLPVSRDAVILTVEPPAVSQKCGVYFKYYFNLPEELKELCTDGFESSYIASALYTLLGRFDLGSAVPQAIKGDVAAHTLVSLNKYLINIGSNT